VDSFINEKKSPAKSVFCSGKTKEKKHTEMQKSLIMQSSVKIHSPSKNNTKDMNTKSTIYYQNFLKEQELEIETIHYLKEKDTFEKVEFMKQTNTAKKPVLMKCKDLGFIKFWFEIYVI